MANINLYVYNTNIYWLYKQNVLKKIYKRNKKYYKKLDFECVLLYTLDWLGSAHPCKWLNKKK